MTKRTGSSARTGGTSRASGPRKSRKASGKKATTSKRGSAKKFSTVARSAIAGRHGTRASVADAKAHVGPRTPNVLLLPAQRGKPVKRSPLREAFLARGMDLVEKMADVTPDDILAAALGKASPMETVATAMTALVAKDRTLDPRDRVLAAARAQGALHMQKLLERAGGAYSADQLAEVLGKTGGRATIGAGRNSNLYFGLPTANGFAYPKLQVTSEGRVLPGLRAFLDAFTLPDPWMKLAILLEPSPRLEGRSPLEALHAGDIDAAVAVAGAYGSHGA